MVIGDSSSDEDEKHRKRVDQLERDSYKGSAKNSIGAKEGVVQSIDFDVKTLMNYHEALIKYSKQELVNRSEKNKSNTEEEIRTTKRKNLFGSDKKQVDLKTLIKKAKVIGDVDEEEEFLEENSFKSNRVSTFTFGQREIEPIQEREEEQKEDVSLSEKIANKLYDNIVNQMVVSIINSSFHDIRIYQKLEGNLNSIVENVIRKESTKIAVESLNDIREQNEKKLKEEKEKEERFAEQLRKQNEEKRIQMEVQKQTINQAMNLVYDEMLATYLSTLCRNCIRETKESEIRKYNNDSIKLIKYDLENKIVTVMLKEISTNLIKHDIINNTAKELCSSLIDQNVTDEVYNIVFSSISHTVEEESKTFASNLINNETKNTIIQVFNALKFKQVSDDLKIIFLKKALNKIHFKVVGSCMKEVSDDACEVAQRNLQEQTIHQMISEVVGSCIRESKAKIKAKIKAKRAPIKLNIPKMKPVVTIIPKSSKNKTSIQLNRILMIILKKI